MRFEDLTRRQKAELLMKDLDAYLAIAGEGHLLLILDGIARTKKGPSREERQATPTRSPKR